MLISMKSDEVTVIESMLLMPPEIISIQLIAVKPFSFFFIYDYINGRVFLPMQALPRIDCVFCRSGYLPSFSCTVVDFSL